MTAARDGVMEPIGESWAANNRTRLWWLPRPSLPCWRRLCYDHPTLADVPGETLDLSLSDQTMASLLVSLYLLGHLLGTDDA
jgi:hypothetical protein